MNLIYQCNGCVRKCKLEIEGTENEYLERYLVCPDVTMMPERKYQDVVIQNSKANWKILS
jgi:hypothetical protein